MTIIGLKELAQNAGKIAARAKAGERFTVVNRSTPMFDIGPHKADAQSDITKTAELTKKIINKNKPAFDELYRK